MPKRWEFCPDCNSGFPNYLGKKKDKHQFECDQCERFWQVEEGKGNFDLRLGMELDEKVIYLQICDKCKRNRPVKLIDLRFICKDCVR